MFIVSKRNIILPGGNGREPISIPKGFIGNIPDRVGNTSYFQALVADGKISLSEGERPKEAKKPSKPRAAKKPPKEESTPKDPPPAPPAGTELSE